MIIPSWILFVVAAWVIIFGAFRIHLGLRKVDDKRPNFRTKGLYARPKRTHILFGVLYIVMGAILIAMGLGWRPILFGAETVSDESPAQVVPDSPGTTVPITREKE